LIARMRSARCSIQCWVQWGVQRARIRIRIKANKSWPTEFHMGRPHAILGR